MAKSSQGHNFSDYTNNMTTQNLLTQLNKVFTNGYDRIYLDLLVQGKV